VGAGGAAGSRTQLEWTQISDEALADSIRRKSALYLRLV
jgi:hypothetical protein